MCGIAGIIAENVYKYQNHLERMVNALQHRGPDGSGTYSFHNCALGHRRLSIVDLETGQQPMLSSVSNAGITFNGEIYGYQSIRKSLLSIYPFKTTSDTEVILALYCKYGSGLLSRLPGMFAFAIWDDAKQELFCARDRFGEKPFYYAFGKNKEFLFASEIKAVLASGLIEPVLSKDSVMHYLKRLYVNPYHTIYQNIHSLPPAHYLLYSNGKISVERYWQLPKPRRDLGLIDAVEEFRKLLNEAVARFLVADVEVGAFLSGGLDSTTIVALASAHKGKLRTFSFGFGDSINELPFAREVAKLYKTEHIELVDRDFDIGELLVGMRDIYDEPFADSANIPTFLISKLSRRHIKVILTGDGGDELVAGYENRYKPLLNMQGIFAKSYWLSYLFLFITRFFKISPFLNRYRKGYPCGISWQGIEQGIEYRQRFGTISNAYFRQNLYFSDNELRELGLDCPENEQKKLGGPALNTVDDAFRMDLQDYMPGDILVKTDRASMANGLELRAPFLDVDFASFCISLPYRLKINTRYTKLILRKAYQGLWPLTIRARGKQGFGAPISVWLKLPSVESLKNKYLNDPKQNIFEIISFKGSQAFVQKNDYQTWALLVLALWMDKYQ